MVFARKGIYNEFDINWTLVIRIPILSINPLHHTHIQTYSS